MGTREWEEGAEDTWQLVQANLCEQTEQENSGPPWKRTGVSFMPPRQYAESAANLLTCRSDILIHYHLRSIILSRLQKAGTHQTCLTYSWLIVGVTDRKVTSSSSSNRLVKRQRLLIEIFRCILTGSIIRQQTDQTYRGDPPRGSPVPPFTRPYCTDFRAPDFFEKGKKGSIFQWSARAKKTVSYFDVK